MNSTLPDADPAVLADGSRTWARAAIGGLLMGLANLVPGISGGTMLLAAGIYTRFIEAVSGVTRMRWERRDLLFLLVVVAAAAIGIVLLAGPVKDLVVERRWVMYSLFVGLTVGGIPSLWRLVRPGTWTLWIGVAAGFLVMAGVALAQQTGTAATGSAGGGFLPLFVAGAAAAASMILPGISGGYLLLVLGQYVPILSAIERAAEAAGVGDVAAVSAPVLEVFVPVGLGLLVGVGAVANVLRWLLRAHRVVTLGFLLGLLGGVVVGLWPFQQGVAPQPGDIVKGRITTTETMGGIDPEDWPVRVFRPDATQAAGAMLLVLAGAAATLAIARFGATDG